MYKTPDFPEFLYNIINMKRKLGDKMKILYTSKLDRLYKSGAFFTRVMTEELNLPADTMILRIKNKKPFFPDYPNIHFSITHTQNHWLCILADNPIGIDGELASRKINNKEKIMKRFFSVDEQNMVIKSHEPNTEFLSIWTKKEACIKLNGLSLLRDMGKFDTESPDFNLYLQQIILPVDNGKDKLIISICSQFNFGEVNIKVLDLNGEISCLTMRK